VRQWFPMPGGEDRHRDAHNAGWLTPGRLASPSSEKTRYRYQTLRRGPPQLTYKHAGGHVRRAACRGESDLADALGLRGRTKLTSKLGAATAPSRIWPTAADLQCPIFGR